MSKVPALRPKILSVAMCQSLKVMFFLEGHLQNPKGTLANIEKWYFVTKIVVTYCTVRGAFCQFPFRWIYYYGSNKSTGKETGKTHLCAVVHNTHLNEFRLYIEKKNYVGQFFFGFDKDSTA